MSKIIKIFIQVLIVVAVVLSGAYVYKVSKEREFKNIQSKEVKQEEQVSIDTASIAGLLSPSSQDNAALIITFDQDDYAFFDKEVKQGITAFDLLKNASTELKINIETKNYGEMGELVEKIGDKKNGDEGKFWVYYVNGELSKVGASLYKIQKGDRIEWKFEKSTF